ncbi:ArsR/SmtB family transcription factor [Halosolutus gelatinilyticus]|uniref:ArsR/SmtB family transcription factor n=1 Tax=Halosolutus gelatinilyticus TaxID=2931975 RepID=UPI001FF4819F|nr:helix-turn-helix domain-containing protein [Halosolutus gelatinilyticus]
MARLFPFRSEPSTADRHPRVVDLEGEDADAVFGALSSTTARRIYARLDEEPATPSDVADAIDSSIQNVRYHLENLEDAGLVEVVDTWYSSRGNEMSVYATADGPLIVTSDESTASQLKTALSRLIGGIGALAGGSLLVQYGLTRQFGFGSSIPGGTEDSAQEGAGPDERGGDDSNFSGDSAEVTKEETDDAEDGAGDASTETVNDEEDSGADGADGNDAADGAGAEADDVPAADDSGSADDGGSFDSDADYLNGSGGNETDPNGTVDQLTDGGAEAIDTAFGSIPPGMLFFLGGLVVLLAVAIYWYWFAYRPQY